MPPPPGYVDDGAPSKPWGDFRAWEKKRQLEYAPGGWGDNSNKEDIAAG